MPVAKPRRTHTELLARTPFVDVYGHRVAYDGVGRAAENQVLTFACPDWVSVVPVTADGAFVLVRQHRHGVDCDTVEVPGGLIDPGELPDVAAMRELREETGYEGGVLSALGWCHPNPALQGNRHHMFVARGVVPTATPATDDPAEHCEVLVWSRAEVERAMRDGTISHALVLVALSRAFERLAQADRGSTAAGAPGDFAHMLELMRELQSRKVVDLARRIRPELTAEDILNPHDFPELDDPDWHFADGQLAGIESVLAAWRARVRAGESGAGNSSSAGDSSSYGAVTAGPPEDHAGEPKGLGSTDCCASCHGSASKRA